MSLNIISRSPYRAYELEVKLWGGFSQDSLKALEYLKRLRRADKTERKRAAVSLAQWYYFNDNYKKALENIFISNLLSGEEVFDKQAMILESQSLIKLGLYEEARALLNVLRNNKKAYPDLYFLYANTYANENSLDSETERLRLVNEAFQSNGLMPLRKKVDAEPLSITNIASLNNIEENIYQPKISILMPAYNAQDTIGFAVSSILNQTYQNIEIIVVDDCSTDQTSSIVSGISEYDKRLIYLRNPNNVGTYMSRNNALSQSTGHYITVHDSDDWSHPQMLTKQMEVILKGEDVLGTRSYWMRTSSDLFFSGPFKGVSLSERNLSSFLFRRSVIMQMGGWDRVRIGGDAEFIKRFLRIFGDNSLVDVLIDFPLSFSLEQPTNLTRNPETHVKTVYFGQRRDYIDAYEYWHKNTQDI